MMYITQGKVITFFYMTDICLSVVQNGNGDVELLQLTEVVHE